MLDRAHAHGFGQLIQLRVGPRVVLRRLPLPDFDARARLRLV